MSKGDIVWSDEHGDLRKKNKNKTSNESVNESSLNLELRRLTSGKGRTIIEIKGLPNNKKWNQKLAKSLKKSLGVGGAYKEDYIEIHGEKLDEVKNQLEKLSLNFRQVGG